MAKLPKYLLCNNKEALPGSAGLLVCTEPPFFYGRIWLFGSVEEYDKYITIWANSSVSIVKSKLEGYWIVVTIAGSLQDANTDEYMSSLQAIADEMVQLYYSERVSQKEGFYRKYKER
jgi:hypothetical protein